MWVKGRTVWHLLTLSTLQVSHYKELYNLSTVAPTIWNSLSSALQLGVSPDTFRHQLETCYFQLVFQFKPTLHLPLAHKIWIQLTSKRVYKLCLLTYLVANAHFTVIYLIKWDEWVKKAHVAENSKRRPPVVVHLLTRVGVGNTVWFNAFHHADCLHY